MGPTSVALLLLATASAGCGLLAPLHDLSPDASTDTDESNAPGTDETSTTDPDPSDGLDASSTAETGTSKDADAEQDAGPPFCDAYYNNPKRLACDDFDRGAQGGGWATEGGGALIDVDVDQTFSSSASLHIWTTTTSGPPKTFLSRNFDSGPHNPVCSFDFSSDLGDGDPASVRIFDLGIASQGDFWRVELVLQNGSITANERTPTTTRTLAKSPATSVKKNTRVPIVVSVQLTPTPKFELRIANAVVTSTAEIAPTLTPGTLQTSLRVDFASAPISLWSMRYDNFLCLEK